MTTIPLQDGDVLFLDGEVAASERCRCLCDAECLSITLAGFGPDGEPCVECGQINGTYTLERRPVIPPWGWGPWTFSWCGPTTCLYGEVAQCLEIVLVLGCDEHNVYVSVNGQLVASATVENDGTPCDDLTFSTVTGETCDPAGTITTAPGTCGESQATRCCDCEDCGTPSQWAIVDLTTGFTILSQGTISGSTIDFLPESWRARCWTVAPMPAVLTFGLFAYSTPANRPNDCAVWFPLDIWTVTPRKCSGGEWWDDHTFAESYPSTECNPEGPLTVTSAGPLDEYTADTFTGAIDCEWTNMANWSTPSSPGDCGLYGLPTSSTAVTISGVPQNSPIFLLGNAAGTAAAGTLAVLYGASVGIHITVADTASIDGVVLGDCECAATLGPACCPTDSPGWIDAAGAVTITGKNRGKITGASVTFTSTGPMLETAKNDGGLVTSSGTVAFNDTAKNYGKIQAATIAFNDQSENHDPPRRGECEWREISPNLQGSVEFHDDAVNYGSSFSAGFVVFRGGSSNAASARIANACQFLDDAVNYGQVGDGSEFGQQIEAGSPTSKNAASGAVNGSATFYTENYGTVRGNASFPTAGRNYGTVEGDGDFSDSGENNAGGEVFGNATFGGTGWNYGVVRGNATFDGDSINYGTIRGSATFNGNSSNLGTVRGTIICNTTGTCP